MDLVSNITKPCYCELRRIAKIRGNLTFDAAANLVRSLVISKLDYANCLLYGLPDVLLKRLQLVQNNAARLVFRKRKNEHVNDMLKHIHWLPV